MRTVVALAAFFAAAALIAGCSQGSKMAPVKGAVTCKGNPVPNVAVIFSPMPKNEGDLESGKAANGGTDANGAYSLTTFKPGDGALIGTHRVSIVMDNAVPCPCKPKVVTLEVKPGDNVLNIELND